MTTDAIRLAGTMMAAAIAAAMVTARRGRGGRTSLAYPRSRSDLGRTRAKARSSNRKRHRAIVSRLKKLWLLVRRMRTCHRIVSQAAARRQGRGRKRFDEKGLRAAVAFILSRYDVVGLLVADYCVATKTTRKRA